MPDDTWTHATVCQHCDKEIEYVESDEMEREDYNYDEEWYQYIVIVCPNCGCETRVG